MYTAFQHVPNLDRDNLLIDIKRIGLESRKAFEI